MVYITGDCHAEYGKFSTKRFHEQREMTRDDFVIVCGDFGIWHDNATERWWLDWLNDKPFTLLFVDGNHENFDRLYGNEFQIVDFHGGKAHRIRDNVYHLMRGYIFELCGKKFFAFGGASSHDIDDGILDLKDYDSMGDLVEDYQRRTLNGEMLRINHASWWEQELPTESEMRFGVDNLASNGNQVDYIITHCCPQHVASVFSNGFYKPDKLTCFFNTICETVQFDRWYFGHYHDDKTIMGKFVLLYDKIERVV